MAIIPGVIVDWSLSPRVIIIPIPLTEIIVADMQDTLLAIEESEDGICFPKLRDCSGGQDLGGGVSVGWTIQLNNAQIMFEGRHQPLYGGTITQTDPLGKYLIDDNAHFISDGDIYIGCNILNMVSGEMCTVVEILSETVLRHKCPTPMIWNAGDDYVIYPNVQCSMSGGNWTATDENGNSISPILQSPNVQITMTSSASATLQELKDIQHSSFNGGVSVDTTSPYSGIEYPVGTSRQPVNNMNDALAIALGRGFSTFYIIGDIYVDNNGDYSTMIFIGESLTKSHINVSPGANVYKSEFSECTLSGTLDGEAVARHCRISNLYYISGVVEQCLLETGTITLGGSREAVFLDCWEGTPGLDPPIIDMGGSGQSLIMRNYSGEIKIINKNGPEKVSITLSAGYVIIDGTVTNGGQVIVSGIGAVENNSTIIIDQDGLMSKETITKINWHEIHLDIENGFSGTQFPIGTSSSPSNNLTDALIIALRNGIDHICFLGEITLETTIEHIEFRGAGTLDNCIVNLNNQYLNNILFKDCRVRGKLNANVIPGGGWAWGKALVQFTSCYLEGIENLEGTAIQCQIEGLTKMKLNGWLSSIETVIEGDFTVFDMQNHVCCISMDINSGWAQFINAVEGSLIELNVKGGEVSLDTSCIGGDYYLEGIGTLYNDSAMVLKENHFPWDEPKIYHQIPGSTGEALSLAIKWHEVYIDIINGEAGTQFPIGTHLHPSNNIADTINIANANEFTKIRLIGNITFHSGENIGGFIIEGEHFNNNTVTLESGVLTSGAIFSKVKLTGTCGGGHIHIEDCQLENLFNLSAYDSNSNVLRCQLNTGTIQLANLSRPQYQFDFVDCWSGAVTDMTPIIDANNCSSKILLRKHSGAVRFQNVTEGQRVSLDFTSGRVRFDASCVDMDAVVRGSVIIQNNSGLIIDDTATLVPVNIDLDTIINNVNALDTVADNIQIDTNSIESKIDTLSANIGILLDVEQGDWQIINNQMIFKKRNGTELMRFNLFDVDNQPAMEDVYKRVKV